MNRKKGAYIEGATSIVVNFFISLWKIYLGLMYSSIAILADALHSLFDIITSVILIIGYYYVSKPPDKEHPYGHGRAEFISTVIIGSLLLGISIEFFIRSGSKLLSRETIFYNDLIVISLLVMAVIKEALARFAYNYANKLKSDSIRADGHHHRSDAIIMFLLALGIYLGKERWWIDGILGIAVSCFIAYLSIDVIRTAVLELIGRGVSEDEERKIKDLVSKLHEEIHDVHHIHVHRYGDHVELTLHIRIPKNKTVEEADAIAKMVEIAIKEKLGWETTVHVESEKT